MWKDKYFYPGHIASEEKNGKYVIKFEDSNQRTVKDSDIILCDLVSVGHTVFAERGGEGDSEAAVILESHHDEKSYSVQFTSDDVKAT